MLIQEDVKFYELWFVASSLFAGGYTGDNRGRKCSREGKIFSGLYALVIIRQALLMWVDFSTTRHIVHRIKQTWCNM